MSKSRTVKASRNIAVGILSKALLMIIAFMTKTVFIRLLGVEYNGVGGLYTNILSVLAVTELGVGNVLNFYLYGALKKDDKELIRQLVGYFRRVYHIIAFIILTLGICLIPFLKYILNSTLPMEELVMYYILYLINSIVSYFAIYKTSVTLADQNGYLSNVCETIATFIMYGLQIAYLMKFKNFVGYLIIQIFCTILKNVILTIITNKRYPWLNAKTEFQHHFNEKNRIWSDVKATFIYKISSTVVTNTDNILISALVGTVYVGFYSNYYMVITYISSFISILINGIMASLGDLNAEKNIAKSKQMFDIFTLLFSYLGIVSTTCFAIGIQHFIELWIGHQNVMSKWWVVVISLNFYFNTVMSPSWMFRETCGLFKQVKYIFPIEAMLNIIFSVLLGRKYGVPGILISTLIARMISQYWFEPLVVYKKVFQKKYSEFVLGTIKHFIELVICLLISFFITNMIDGKSIAILLIKLVIAAIISFSVTTILCFKTNSYRTLVEWIRNKMGTPDIQM